MFLIHFSIRLLSIALLWLCLGLPLASQVYSVTLENQTHPSISPNFRTGDSFRLTIYGAPFQPVSVSQSKDGGDVTFSSFGNTNGSGYLILTGIQGSAQIGEYQQIWRVGTFPQQLIIHFFVTNSPVASLKNVTKPWLNPDFVLNDSWDLTVVGAPNSIVAATQQKNGGSPIYGTLGSTDASGEFHLSGIHAPSDEGTYEQHYFVNDIEAQPVVIFAVLSALPTPCSVSFSPPDLLLLSYDYYDAFGYIGSYFDSQTIDASTPLNCPQTSFLSRASYPLGLVSVGNPAVSNGKWKRPFTFQDIGVGQAVPYYYPYAAGGVLGVQGLSISSGSPYIGWAPITLLIFPVDY